MSAVLEQPEVKRLKTGDKIKPLARNITIARAAVQASGTEPGQAEATPAVPGLDLAARTLQISFASEAPVERWFGDEVLSMDASAADMSRLNDGANLLFNHDLDDVLGVVERAWLGGDGKAYAVVRFSTDDRGEWALQRVAEGVFRNVSFMYSVNAYRIDSESEDPYYDPDATYTATSWMAYEISIVSVPADQTVGVGRALTVDETSVTVSLPTRSQSPAPAETQLSGEDMFQRKMRLQEQVIERSTGGGAAPVQAQPAAPAVDPQGLSREETIAAVRKLGEKFKMPDLADILIETQADITQSRTAFMQATGNAGQRPVASPVGEMSAKEKASYSLIRAVNAAVNNDWKEAGFEREVSQTIQRRMEANPDAPKAAKAGGNGVRFYVPTDLPFAPDEKHARAWRLAGGGAKLQTRAPYQVGTASQGGNLVQTSLLDQNFIEVLRNASVTAQLGARYLTGLVGNVDIPRQTSQTTGYWVGESGAITEAEATFDKVSLRIKTIAALSKMSRLMLLQSTPAIEMLAREDLIAVLALYQDLAALSGSGSSNQPTGIVNTAGVNSIVGGTNGANLSFDHIIQMKTAPKISNAPMANLGFALNSKAIGYLETLKSTTGQYLWSNGGGVGDGTPNTLKGYNYAESQQLRYGLTKGTSAGVCSELIFGNWRELLIAEWGVVELMVNPFDSTGFANGDVIIRAFQSLDIGLRHPASFAVMSDALTPGF
jgi:HK97 family phage major capsid protein